MELEPLLRVALAVHTNKGVYSLLLGSGTSRSAGILTGWEIVLDLTRKLEKLVTKKDPRDDPEGWYEARYKEALTYTGLMNRLAKTPAERQGLLRPYFEPGNEEKQQGLKSPTAAHRAIAKLVGREYIRMIITTNFDRLIETALEAEGISPEVVATEDAFLGVLPYVHSRCYVVKLHGDYRDTRLRNTPDEVAQYPRLMRRFLSRVFDEFGLIICGWSSQWDVALRDALMASASRRFSTFWVSRGKPHDEAMQIIEHRRAEVIAVKSAEDFFPLLVDQIDSLEDIDKPHPVSVAVAVASVKRYLTEPANRVRLHDLVLDEAEKVRLRVAGDEFFPPVPPSEHKFQALLGDHQAAVERLGAMSAALSYHDNGQNSYMLKLIIEGLGSQRGPGGYSAWQDLAYYSALLLEYICGVSALPLERYSALAALLIEPSYRDPRSRERVAAISRLHPWAVFRDTSKLVPRPDAKTEFTPASNHIFDAVRPFVKDYISSDDQYEEFFDIFEYILSLTYWDIVESRWTFVGRFGWKYSHRFEGLSDAWAKSPPARFIEQGLARHEWGFLKAGFFAGSAERLMKAVNAHTQLLKSVVSTWN